MNSHRAERKTNQFAYVGFTDAKQKCFALHLPPSPPPPSFGGAAKAASLTVNARWMTPSHDGSTSVFLHFQFIMVEEIFWYSQIRC